MKDLNKVTQGDTVMVFWTLGTSKFVTVATPPCVDDNWDFQTYQANGSTKVPLRVDNAEFERAETHIIDDVIGT